MLAFFLAHFGFTSTLHPTPTLMIRRMRRDRHGELRQGVYVSAKGGVAAGEELLINYGKPFWRARVGSLDAFVHTRPG